MDSSTPYKKIKSGDSIGRLISRDTPQTQKSLSFVFVDDAVSAIMSAIKIGPISTSLNICHDEHIEWKNFVEIMAASLSPSISDIRWNDRKNLISVTVGPLDNALAKRHLIGWKPTSLKKAIEFTVQWYEKDPCRVVETLHEWRKAAVTVVVMGCSEEEGKNVTLHTGRRRDSGVMTRKHHSNLISQYNYIYLLLLCKSLLFLALQEETSGVQTRHCRDRQNSQMKVKFLRRVFLLLYCICSSSLHTQKCRRSNNHTSKNRMCHIPFLPKKKRRFLPKRFENIEKGTYHMFCETLQSHCDHCSRKILRHHFLCCCIRTRHFILLLCIFLKKRFVFCVFVVETEKSEKSEKSLLKE